MWLIAYEPNEPRPAWWTPIIQRIDPDGTVGFEWTSAPYADETVTAGDPDYAHINSIDLMDDGDLLASFRSFSSVFKIATDDLGGHQAGDVVWKLGGLDSTFAFEDADGAPDSGPCAQHTARELADGTILLFDNGSATPMCADPDDPDRAVVSPRPDTRVLTPRPRRGRRHRVVERSYAPGRFAPVRRIDPAHRWRPTRLIGWAFNRAESPARSTTAGVEQSGSCATPTRCPTERYFSYRAHLAVVPDVTAPEVSVESPSGSVVYDVGDEPAELSYRCTDRGGSSLQTCQAGTIDTSLPGEYAVDVTATDGAGNTTTVSRPYTVLPPFVAPTFARADVWVRVKPRAWVGRDVYGSSKRQRATTSLRRHGAKRVVLVRLENDGDRAAEFLYAVSGSKRGFRVTSSSDLSDLVQIGAGKHLTLRLTVKRTRQARPGSSLVLRTQLRPTDVESSLLKDAASVRVTARR